MNSTHSRPDPEGLELAEACNAGDRRAQYALWSRYKNRMFGLCLRFAASRVSAEDMLQEAFVRVFHDIGNYRGEGSLEGWIRRIVVRTALQALQKQPLSAEMMNEEHLEKAIWHTDQFFEGADEDEPSRLVALLQQLPPGFRAVLNLYAIEDHSHEEIGRELNISVGTSKSQLHRAKAFMRRLLNKTLLLI